MATEQLEGMPFDPRPAGTIEVTIYVPRELMDEFDDNIKKAQRVLECEEDTAATVIAAVKAIAESK